MLSFSALLVWIYCDDVIKTNSIGYLYECGLIRIQRHAQHSTTYNTWNWTGLGLLNWRNGFMQQIHSLSSSLALLLFESEESL